MYLFISVFFIVFVLNFSGFLFGYFLKTDRFTDIIYSLSFVCAVIAGLIFFQNIFLPHLILSGMVILWAVRLGAFLFSRIHKMKTDKRFDSMRNSFLKFGGFWLLQAISISILILPVLFIIEKSDFQIGIFQWFGILIFGIGFLIESISDFQKSKFKLIHPDKLFTKGLYSWVQYPNYLGEIMVWVGIFVFGVNIYEGAEWLGIISPLWIFILLRYISGIPLVEQKRDKVYSQNSEYKAYTQNTPKLIPFFK